MSDSEAEPHNGKTEPLSEIEILKRYEEILHSENASLAGHAVLDCLAICGALMTLWLMATL